MVYSGKVASAPRGAKGAPVGKKSMVEVAGEEEEVAEERAQVDKVLLLSWLEDD